MQQSVLDPARTNLHAPVAEPQPATDIPRPEHPRPDFQRDSWINLNGRWRFTFDPQNLGEQLRWYRVSHPTAASRFGEVADSVEDPFRRDIVVPFPWESRLSGIGDTAYKGAAWYQRAIEIPRDWAEPSPLARPAKTPQAAGQSTSDGPTPDATNTGELLADTSPPQGPLGEVGFSGSPPRLSRPQVIWRKRAFLCFGAVDWSARVWINGRFVAEHDGGYTPFEVDISRFVRPGVPATLTVRAWDAADADTPLGKQVEDWYTHSGGIWQTVWVEGRPPVHLSRAHITPHLEDGTANFCLRIHSPADFAGTLCRLAVESADGLFPLVEREVQLDPGHTDTMMDVRVPHPKAWSPEEPHLYDCVLTLVLDHDGKTHQDRVSTYFGLRSISAQRWENRPYEYVFLNGEPVYLRGVLDQAFHPDALHAYPSDDAIRADVQAAKDLGFNMLRCHIKINDPRYYYWCDRLGVLMMYDFPSASIYTPKARANWEATFRAALDRDYSHPCIFSWILFNETWGLEEHQRPESWRWVRDMYYLAKQLDPTRLVEDNSTYLWDHVTTDINSWHFYIGDYDRARRHIENVVSQTYEGSPYHFVAGVYGDVEEAAHYRQGTQPLLNSEYAGISAWGGDVDISYTFKFLTTELRRHDIICGYVYTELADIEWEHNGLLNYDRTKKEFGYDHFLEGMTVADMNGADFVGFDCPPCQTLPPGSTFKAPVFISHWNTRPMNDPILRWRVTTVDRFGEKHLVTQADRPVILRRFGVTDGYDIEVPLPDAPGLVTVALILLDGDGTIRARNYVNVDLYEGEASAQAAWMRQAQSTEKCNGAYALRFHPGDFLGSSWGDPRIGPRGSKFGASGAGWVDYALTLSPDITLESVKGMRLLFEAGSRTAKSRVDWKDQRHMRERDYPQTEERKLPTDLIVWVNGVRFGSVRLPDDPADARGVLSAHNSESWEFAGYGYLTKMEVDRATAQRILAESQRGKILIRFEVPAIGIQGGLNLYGSRLGAYPLDPMLLIDTE
jgi:hypothetical protein